MTHRLLPRTLDQEFHGSTVSLWVFGLVLFVKVAISLGCIFNGYVAAGTTDGIPLASFTPAGAQTVVACFAIWGVSQLTIYFLCVLALVRYRALVPFLFSVILVEHLVRKLALILLPIPKTGTPPGSVINLVLVGLMVVGLGLSLWRRAGVEAKA